MKRFFQLGLVLFLTIASVGSQAAGAHLKSFQEWKKEKLQVALVQSNNLRSQILRAQLEGNTKLQNSLERQLQQVRWNAEVARDLSVTDYFVLYLSQQNQEDRFLQAAQKMSTVEVAELIEAYTGALGYRKVETQLPKASGVELPKTAIPAQAAQQK